MRTLTLVTLFVFSIFAAQVVRIQGIDAAQVARSALEQRTKKVVLQAERGRILSSDGVVLAASRQRVAVIADPRAVCTYGTLPAASTCDPARRAKALDLAAADLAPVLGMPRATVRARLGMPTRYAVLTKDASPLTWRRVSDLKIPGIYPDERKDVAVPERLYPQGRTASSLVGLVYANGQPIDGIERLMDAELQGTTGLATYETAQDGSMIPGGRQQITPAVDGRDVTLTINSNVQWYAQNALARQVQKFDALSGTAVVMNAKTGRLLAVATYPTFDPAHIRSTTRLSNPAFADAFEPGSTAKIMTVAAALSERAVTPDTPVVIPNRMPRFDRVFKDSHDHPTLYRTVAGALAESSNIGTILIGETMSAQTLERYFRGFGVGTATGVGFPNESKGELASSERWNGPQRDTIMFGQGLSMTAVQVASVFQVIANGGVRVAPSIIQSTTDAAGHPQPAPAPATRRVVTPQVAAQVSAMLEGVVSKEGTAPEAAIAGYRVAGKTGTSARYDWDLKKYSGKIGSFIGYAPADDPELIVGVIIDRPRSGFFGGIVAAPVFHDVMTYALQELKVTPTGTRAARITTHVSARQALEDPTVLREKPHSTAR